MSLPVLLWIFVVFVTGSCVGSFVNVCVYRLVSERSVFWPGSHCASCLRPIAWFDNIPILGYVFLWGKCRKCGTSFSPRYVAIEFLSGLMFVAVFLLDVVYNTPNYFVVSANKYQITCGLVPWSVWFTFISHATLLSFLLTASLTDLDKMEIPLGITVTGTIIGVLFSTFMAWPFPDVNQVILPSKDWPLNPKLPQGAIHWPVWYPYFSGFESQVCALGFMSSFAGIIVGTFFLRIIRFTYGLGRGIEGMGLGDADLMMMVGAFWGWQIVIVSFFLAVIPAFIFGILQLFRKGEQAFPFGPSLAISSVCTFYCWKFLSSYLQPVFFEFSLLFFLGCFSVVFLLIISFALRLLNKFRMNQID